RRRSRAHSRNASSSRSSVRSATSRLPSRASTREERSGGLAARKGIGITVWSLQRSARPTDGRDELMRRFVESARRAHIGTILNRAQTESELGDHVTAELCEVFEAEIAFILSGSVYDRRAGVGSHGLAPNEAMGRPGEG